MNALWTYFWPVFAVALAIGAIAGTVAFRRPRRRIVALGCGLLVAIAAAALWHGPLGAADQFSARIERGARQALDYYEMTKVTAKLQREPLSRRLILSGPADDFQHSELVRVLAVTAVADTFANARARAYRAVDQIDFADGFHRRDIGWRELERTPA